MSSLNQPILISVIIPVLNDVEGLKNCLIALEQQTFLKSQCEIIVVDNGPNSAIKNCVANFPNVRYLVESFPTGFAARNTGILEARGKILAFTDADCIPDPKWLEKGVEKLLNMGNYCIIAGHIDVFPANRNYPTSLELFEIITALPQDELVKRWNFGATANIFIFKQIIETVGLFDASLASGGDLEWGQRANRFGYQVVYTLDAIVRHPARTSWRAICRRAIRIIGGVHQITQKRYPNRKFSSRLFGLIKDLWYDWPNFADFLAIFYDQRIPSLNNRLQVLLISLGVKFVRYSERIRLFTGADFRTDYFRH